MQDVPAYGHLVPNVLGEVNFTRQFPVHSVVAGEIEEPPVSTPFCMQPVTDLGSLVLCWACADAVDPKISNTIATTNHKKTSRVTPWFAPQ